MIARKETTIVRLEIEMVVLIGALRVMEADLKRMPLRQLLDIWEPEIIKSRIMLMPETLEEVKESERVKRRGRKETKKVLPKTDNSQIHNRGK